MDINRVKTYGKVGTFLIGAQTYIAGEICRVMSRPIGEEGLEEFLRDYKNFLSSPSTPTMIFAINSKFFDGNWPRHGSLISYEIYQITENGLDTVEVTL